MEAVLDERLRQAYLFLMAWARREGIRHRLSNTGYSDDAINEAMLRFLDDAKFRNVGWALAIDIEAMLRGVDDAGDPRAVFHTFCESLPADVPGDDADKAAAVLVDVAETLQDRHAWIFCLDVFDKFVTEYLPPPTPLLLALNRVFRGIRSGRTFDELIGPQRPPTRGRKGAGLDGRNWARVNALLVNSWVAIGVSVDEACEKVSEVRKRMDESMDMTDGKPRTQGHRFGTSESTIKRDYLAWKRGDI